MDLVVFWILSADVDSKGRVWWVRAINRSQEMLLILQAEKEVDEEIYTFCFTERLLIIYDCKNCWFSFVFFAILYFSFPLFCVIHFDIGTMDTKNQSFVKELCIFLYVILVLVESGVLLILFFLLGFDLLIAYFYAIFIWHVSGFCFILLKLHYLEELQVEKSTVKASNLNHIWFCFLLSFSLQRMDCLCFF